MTKSNFVEDQDTYVCGLDGDQFMNHSDDPNIRRIGVEWVTCRDIVIGDEITCDYRETTIPTFNPETGLPFNGHFDG